MKQAIFLIFICLDVLSGFCQDIRVNAGMDLKATCFDEVQLNARIINWTRKSTPEFKLKSITFINDSIGYAVGGQADKGQIIKTTDGGKTWNEIGCPADRFLNDVLFLNKDTGFVVGGRKPEGGIILKTIDGGISWTSKDGPPGVSLNAVYFAGNSIGYAVGDSSMIMKTMDGGDAWTEMGVPDGLYNDVFFISGSTGFLVGDKGRLIKTTNGGITWQVQETHIVFNLYSLACKGAKGYIAGADGLLLGSDNLFSTYSILNSGVLSDLFDIKLISESEMIAVGSKNTIITSGNGGLSWKKEFSDFEGDLYCSACLENGKQFAVGAMPGVTNIGCVIGSQSIPASIKTIWTPSKNLSDPRSLNSLISPLVTTQYILEVDDSEGLKMRDTLNVNVQRPFVFAGRDQSLNQNDTVQLFGLAEFGRFDLISNDSRADFNGTCFINRDTGFIAGSRTAGMILKTTDGGRSWQHKIYDLNAVLKEITFPDESVGYAVGDSGTILKTNDCGEHWKKQTSNITERINSVFFVTKDIGYVAGTNGTILKTTNGGNLWQKQYINSSLDLNKIYFLSENKGFATAVFSWECAFFETSDGGNSWHKIVIPDLFIDFTDIFFVNEKLGYMIGSTYGPFAFIKTTDGGETWKHQLFPRQYDARYTSVWFTDEYTGYVTDGDGEILKTSDGGNTWYIWRSIKGGLNDLFFKNKFNAYGVGNEGVSISYHSNDHIKISWSPDYNIINGNTLQPLVFPYQTRTYYLQAYTDEGCYTVDGIRITVYKSTGINEVAADRKDILIYPNPSDDRLTICFNNSSPQVFQIRIINNNGALVYQNSIFSVSAGEFLFYHNLPSGFYFMEVTCSESTIVKKFIVK